MANRKKTGTIMKKKAFRFLFLPVLVSVLFGCENLFQVGLGDKVDIGPPQITLESHASGAYLRGTVTLSGVATDDQAVSRVEISHDRGSSWASVTTHDANRGEWSHTLNTTTRPDGRLSVTLRATDTAGKTQTSDELLFSIDNTPPIVLVTGPRNAADLILNTRAVLTVAATDVHPIIRFGVDVHGATPTDEFYAGDAELDELVWEQVPGYPKTVAQNASPWTYVFNSLPHTSDKTLSNGTPDPEPHRFFRFDVWAEDEAGNRSADFFVIDDVAAVNNNVELTIDQIAALFRGETIEKAGGGTLTSDDLLAVVYPRADRRLVLEFDEESDIPKARITYPTAPEGSMPTMKSLDSIQGYFEDDDGLDLSTMEYRIENGTMSGDVFVPSSGLGWQLFDSSQYDLNTEIGNRRIDFRLPIASFGLGYHRVSLRAVDIGGTPTNHTPRVIVVSDGAPNIEIEPPGIPFFSDQVVVSGTASHSFELAGVYVSLGYGPTGSTTWPPELENLPAEYSAITDEWTFDSDGIDLSALPEGSIRFRARALEETRQITLTKDTGVPTIGYDQPAGGSPLNTTAVIRGFADDALSGVECVALTVVASGAPVPPAGCDTWWNFASGATLGADGYEFSGTLTNWVFRFDTTAFVDGPITIHARARDRAGNATIVQRNFVIDQESDRPIITFLNVDPSGGFLDNVLDGEPRLLGSIKDDTNVDPSTFRYRVQPDGGAWSVWRNVYASPPANTPELSFNFAVKDPDNPSENIPTGLFTLEFELADEFGVTSLPLSVEVAVNSGPPEVSLTGPEAGTVFGGAIPVTGTAVHPLGINRVEISLNNGTTYSDLYVYDGVGIRPVSYDVDHVVDPGTVPDGQVRIRVRATDGSGNAGTDSVTVVYDTVPPLVEITNISPIVFGESGDDDRVNNVISLTALASDLNGIDGLKYWMLPDGSDPPTYATPGGVEDTDAPYSFVIDTRELADETSHVLYVVARDRGGNETRIERVLRVEQSSDLPNVEFTDLDPTVDDPAALGAGGVNLLDFNARIRGVISDDDRVDASSIRVRLNDHAGPFTGLTGPVGPNSRNVSFTHNLSLGEGVHFFYLEFSDLASAKTQKDGSPAVTAVTQTVGPIYFAIDTAPPVIEFLSPAPGSFLNADFSVSGTATDANGLVTADLGSGETEYILVRPPGVSDWAAADEIPVSGGTWTYPISGLFDGTADGVTTITVRATDRFGKSTTLPFSFTVDTVPPTVAVSQPGAGAWLSGTSSSVSGTASDTNGVAQVRFWAGAEGAVPPGDLEDWTLASGTWNGTINLSELGEGEKELHVRARDVAGNWSTAVTRAFGVDQDPPVVTETVLGAASVERNEIFSIGGIATDSNALASITVTQRRGAGDTVTVLDGTPLSGTSAPWSLGSLPRDPDAPNPADPGAVDLSDGVYHYTIIVTDVSGKTHQATRTVTVDLTGPIVTINTPADGQIVSGSAFNATGTAADVEDVSAIAAVRYWIGAQGAEPPVDPGTWSLASGTGSWTASLDLAALGEGRKTLHVVGRDAAGNWSEDVATRSFIVDQSPPSVSETTVGTGTVYRNSAFSLGGTAADTNELESLTVIQGGVELETVPLSGDSDTWVVAALPRNPADVGETLVTDGLFSFTILVTDIAGRTSEVTRTVTVDTTAPTVTIQSLIPVVPDNRVNGVISIAVNATDTNGLDDVRWWFIPTASPAPEFGTPGGTSFGDAPYTTTIDTTVLDDETAYTLYVIGRDRADNDTIVTRELTVDQSSDAPVVTFSDYDNGGVFNDTPFSIGGNVTDDDGLALLEWKLPTDLEWTEIQSWDAGHPTSYAWSINLELADGVGRTIEVRATDRLGETAFAQSVTTSPPFDVLTASPIITFTLPETGAFFNDALDIPVEGTALVDSGDVVVTTLEYQIGTGGDWTDVTAAYDAVTETFATTVPVPDGTPDGVIRIRIRATGSNERTSIEAREVRIDTVAPTVAFSAPSADAVVNGLLTVHGTANDNNALDRVQLEVIRVPTDVVVASFPDLGRFTWTTSTPIDTRDLADGAQYRLRATAFDAAGNNAVIERTITVDQSTDTPQVSFSNLAVGGGTIFMSDGSIFGTAIDDDGVDRIEYRFNGSGDWTTIVLGGSPNEGFSIPYTALADGPHTVTVRVYDIVGFDAGTFESAPIAFRIDRVPPEIAITAPAVGSYQGDGFTATGTSSDANGVAGVAYRVGTVGEFSAVTSFDPGTGAWSTEIPVTGGDGEATVYVRATDLAGRTTTVTRNFIFDTTPPEISFSSPGAGPGTVVNRTVTVTGTSSDATGSVSSVRVFVLHDNGVDTTELAGTVGTTNWTASFDTTRVSEPAGDLFGYGLETAPGSGVWDVTLRATAIDTAGNEGSVERVVRIDQSTNRPVIAFTNLPALVYDGSPMYTEAGSIAVNVTDDDGIAFIEYRFNGGTWIEITGSGGLNENFSVPMSGLSDGVNTIQVRAQDTVGGLESLGVSDIVTFRLDTTNPDVAITAPLSGSFQSSAFVVDGTASDANGIDRVEIRILELGTWSDAVLTGNSWTATLAVAGLSEGSRTIQVRAFDNAGRQREISRDFTYDVTAPVVVVNSPPIGSVLNGRVTINAAVTESYLDTTQYYIGRTDTMDPQDIPWLAFANPNNPSLTINDINVYAGNETFVIPTAQDGIWRLEIPIRALDRAGNVTIYPYYILVDPDQDNPETQIFDPIDGSTVGGRIRVSGAAFDDDAVLRVEIAFYDVDGSDEFIGQGIPWPTPEGGWPDGVSAPTPLTRAATPTGLDETFDDGVADYWYAVNPNTPTWSNWNINVNTYGEFDPPPGEEIRRLGIRVRAIDTKNHPVPGIQGVPESITVSISSEVPSIEDLNIQNGQAIGGSITVDGIVRDIEGIESFSFRGQSSIVQTTNLIVNGSIVEPAWISLIPGGDPDYLANKTSYRFTIPLNTSFFHPTSGPLSIRLDATSSSAAGFSTSTSFNVFVDNIDPTAAVAPNDGVVVYTGGTFTGPTTSYPVELIGTQFTLSGTANDTGNVAGLTGVVVYLLDDVGFAYDLRRRTYAHVPPTPLAATPILTAAQIQSGETYVIVETGSTEFRDLGAPRSRAGTIFTASRDGIPGDGTGTVLPEHFYAFVDNLNENFADDSFDGDMDGFPERLQRTTTEYNWFVQLDSTELPDGPVTIHTIAVDHVGNFSTASLPGLVANNRPVVDFVTVATDLTGNEIIDESSEREFAGQAEYATGFTVRNSRLRVTIDTGVTGNPPVQYELFYDPENGNPLVPVYSGSGGTILVDDFASIPDTSVPNGARFVLTAIDDLGVAATVVLRMNVDNIDTVPPSIALAPFGQRWSIAATDSEKELGQVLSYNENLVTTGSGAQTVRHGYVQYAEHSTNGRTDLSGKVVFTGRAADNQRISRITAQIPGFNGGVEFDIATWDVGIGGLTTAGLTVADVAAGTAEWGFRVQELSQFVTEADGHVLNWEFAWNSAAITNTAVLDVPVTFRVYDFNGDNDGAPDTDDAFDVDVVPYITRVTNPVGQGGLSDAVLRSSSGRYSIESHPTRFFRVSGFNLLGAEAHISPTPIDVHPGTTNMTVASGNATTVDLRKTITNSGYLTLFVNGVASINNVNDNSQEYHSESSVMNPRSVRWNDDRYIVNWDLRQVLPTETNQTFYYPSMVMDGNQPIFSYANDNLGRTFRTTGDTTTAQRVGRWYERQTAIARNESGRYFIVSSEDAFSGANIGYLQINTDRNAAARIDNLQASAAGVFELVGSDWDGTPLGGTVDSRQLNRFKYPNLIVTGENANTQVYLSYYDSHPDRRQVQFFSFQITNAAAGNPGTNLNQPTRDFQIASNGNMVVTGTANASSEYTAMTLINGEIAIAFYDESAANLKIRHSANHTTDGLANTGATWEELVVDASPFSGRYVSMTNDGSYVYLAYYDAGSANLVFSRIDWATKVVERFVIDAYLSVGTWTNITLIDGLPHISYYSDSYNGTRDSIRMAYPVDAASITSHGVQDDGASDMYTGTWEILAVPTATAPKGGMEQFNRTHIDVYTDGTSTLPVVGWLADRLEYARLRGTE
ncbi:MAG: hypothetical protein EA426_14430 [Spirochaetaceae bacterium]|nr:MAG: hypothetical protein EA426_14430 [Spirochaetaceae bacterium]